uniref:CCHC-type domain-containing protein n=1 Tax=Trichogramma kaykai TaxID=54128 RepID=A0ABD2WHI0_9HYME
MVLGVPTSRLIPRKKKNLFGILNVYSAYVSASADGLGAPSMETISVIDVVTEYLEKCSKTERHAILEKFMTSSSSGSESDDEASTSNTRHTPKDDQKIESSSTDALNLMQLDEKHDLSASDNTPMPTPQTQPPLQDSERRSTKTAKKCVNFSYTPDRDVSFATYDNNYLGSITSGSRVDNGPQNLLIDYSNENSNSNSRNTYIRDALDGFNGIMKRIPKFNGKPEKLPLFCEAVRAAARQMPSMQREIIHSLEAKLVDEAEEYVGLLISYTSISDLLEDLRDRFGNRSVAEALVLELGRTIQGTTEPVRSYSSRIQILYNRALIRYDMAPDINDIERRAAKIALNRNVLSCFLHGLREPIQNHTRLCIPSNLPDAIRKAIDVERETLLRAATGSNISAMGLLNVPLTAPLPSKIAQEHSTGSESADATSSPKKEARKEGKMQCQYCFKYNHVAADCRKLKHDLLFCNNCHLRGHEAATCRRQGQASAQTPENDTNASDRITVAIIMISGVTIIMIMINRIGPPAQVNHALPRQITQKTNRVLGAVLKQRALRSPRNQNSNELIPCNSMSDRGAAYAGEDDDMFPESFIHSLLADDKCKGNDEKPAQHDNDRFTLHGAERVSKIMQLMDTDGCNNEQLAAIKNVVEHKPYTFGLEGEPLPISNLITCSITTTTEKPLVPKYYRYPPKLKVQMQKEIDKLLKGDIIVPSKPRGLALFGLFQRKPWMNMATKSGV